MNYLAYEVNFDGLVGITHCFGGLAPGNLASTEHKGQISNPKQAALQGLDKMRFISSLGVKQAVLPPHERPHLPSIRALGFNGQTIRGIFERVKSETPWLFPEVSSSASMWAANSATVSPSIDSIDSHVHFTPANLATYFHRSIEAETTSRLLKAIFQNPVLFEHHAPLLPGDTFLDEGAANHTRFCKNYHDPGVQLFVYGQRKFLTEGFLPSPQKFPARQTYEASNAIARLHQLYPGHTVFALQNPEAIDAGVFHNDVISVGNQNVFLVHEKAFFLQSEVIRELREKVAKICDTELIVIQITEDQLSLKEAVASYLFNSQIITLPDGTMSLIAPQQCQKNEKTSKFLRELTLDNDNPISTVHFVDLSESMQNGGGPACLRLRVVLNENEMKETNQGIFLTDHLYQRLRAYIEKYYPTRLTLDSLTDSALYELNCKALIELTDILNLGKVYSFQ